MKNVFASVHPKSPLVASSRALAAVLLASVALSSSAACGSAPGADDALETSSAVTAPPVDTCDPVDCPWMKGHPGGVHTPPPAGSGPCGAASERCCPTGTGTCNGGYLTCVAGTCQPCGLTGTVACANGACFVGISAGGTCVSCDATPITGVQTASPSEASAIVTYQTAGAIQTYVTVTNASNANDVRKQWTPITTSASLTFTGLQANTRYDVELQPDGPGGNCAATTTTFTTPPCGGIGQFSCAGSCTAADNTPDARNHCVHCGNVNEIACAGNTCLQGDTVPLHGSCIWNPTCGADSQDCCDESFFGGNCHDGSACVLRVFLPNVCRKPSPGGGGGYDACGNGVPPKDYSACVTCSPGSPFTETALTCSQADATQLILQRHTRCTDQDGACAGH